MESPDNTIKLLKSGGCQFISEAELKIKLEEGRVLRVKLGVDPTSPDLHLGHSVPLFKLRQFQDLGHVAVLKSAISHRWLAIRAVGRQPGPC